jgi:transcriptional regulator with XRE-family HTH domain
MERNIPKSGRERLALVLKKRNLSTRQAAALAGVSDTAISFWQHGHRSPSIASAIRLRDAFGIPLSSWGLVPPSKAA